MCDINSSVQCAKKENIVLIKSNAKKILNVKYNYHMLLDQKFIFIFTFQIGHFFQESSTLCILFPWNSKNKIFQKASICFEEPFQWHLWPWSKKARRWQYHEKISFSFFSKFIFIRKSCKLGIFKKWPHFIYKSPSIRQFLASPDNSI